MRLIDADSLKEDLTRFYDGEVTARQLIDEQPTVEPVKGRMSDKDDCINRQWLMECVSEGWIKFDTKKDENRFMHLVRDIAPSVQPEPHEGYWIGGDGSYICSECNSSPMDFIDTMGASFDAYVETPMNFCPNCGADMRGGQNDND